MMTRQAVALSAALALSPLSMLPVALVSTHSAAYAAPVGQCQEDESCWDCRTMGDLICGPGNAQGVQPGDYSDPNCWPGAIYCPPAGTPTDTTTRQETTS